MAEQIYAGIDVSAESLSVIYLQSGKLSSLRTFPNTSAGHRQISKYLSEKGDVVRICIEPTGTYSLDIAQHLSKQIQFEVMSVNPRAIRDFAKALMVRTKTDACDAAVLAEFAARMPFERWQPPPREVFELRCISRRIVALKKLHQQEKNRLHAASSSAEVPVYIRSDIQVIIKHLARRIALLEKHALKIIAQHQKLQRKFELLVSVRGISTVSAISILGELAALPSDMEVRQWVASAGLDPRQCQSGSSVNKPPRLSKNGNMFLRRALYMPALAAVQHNKSVKLFYSTLLQRHKKPLQALVAVMRKLLHAIFGMFRHNSAFQPELFYHAAM